MDAHQALDIVLDLAPEISFNGVIRLEDRVQTGNLVFCELAGSHVFIEPQFLNDLIREAAANAVDVGKRDLKALFIWNIDPDDSWHVSGSLTIVR
jgi:hypothetical protein